MSQETMIVRTHPQRFKVVLTRPAVQNQQLSPHSAESLKDDNPHKVHRKDKRCALFNKHGRLLKIIILQFKQRCQILHTGRV